MTSIILNEQIHCPASYYFCSEYVPELGEKLLSIFKNNDIESVHMNENTYNWLYRLFNNPIESPINPLSSTIDDKYVHSCRIIFEPNSSFNDGEIKFILTEGKNEIE